MATSSFVTGDEHSSDGLLGVLDGEGVDCDGLLAGEGVEGWVRCELLAG